MSARVRSGSWVRGGATRAAPGLRVGRDAFCTTWFIGKV